LLPLALVLLTGVQQSALAGITQSVPFTGQLVFGGTGTFQINARSSKRTSPVMCTSLNVRLYRML
jgi:hypothetical protein